MSDKKFNIKTLGCKVNQYESDGIAISLEKKGWEKSDKTSDVFIINTCAVTSKACMQSRQAIRKAIKNNPLSKIVVTGCHSQTEPEKINEILNIDKIICNQDKFVIADYIHNYFNLKDKPLLKFTKPNNTKEKLFQSFDHVVTGKNTRAYLKIQDGCDNFCTYCIVPYARGSSVSMSEKKLFSQIKTLKKLGFKEVILTGINTGKYGIDLKEKTSLEKLLNTINNQKLIHRIRLSSIEPNLISDEIISLAKDKNILCNHFHIPLQSGDNSILKKMKRPYNAEFFKEIVLKIHEEIPLVSIGTDVLIGFPDETDKKFENTYKLIEKLPLSYLHVFPFSARKKTVAFHFNNKIDQKIIKKRCDLMRNLNLKKQKSFINKNINETQEAIVLNSYDKKTNYTKAVTSNYLNILLDKACKTNILDVIPIEYDDELNIYGKIKND